MTRVKIKCRSKPTREKKLALLETLSKKRIHVTRIFDTSDGYAITLLNENEADRVFNKDILKELEKHEFTPIIPQQLRVKKSVIINRLNDIIYERDLEEIKEEILLENDWLGDDIESIYKFPRSNTIKLTFSQTSTAKKCTEKGLLAFHLSIPPSDIKQEEYIHITCCTKCYQLDDHQTRNCTKDKDYKICSECSELTHVWHQCQATTKTCINCGENHSTMAMRCQKRKDIIKEKRKLITEA